MSSIANSSHDVVRDAGAALGARARRSLILHLIALAVLAACPLVLETYAINTMGRILAYALLAASLDLLVGRTGLASLGHATYFGIGAYTAGLLAIHVSTVGPLQVLMAMVVAGLAAGATGWVAVRARGVYFLMLTLAIGEITFELAVSWDDVTGGSDGLFGIPGVTVVPGGQPLSLAGHVYWYTLAGFAVCYALLRIVAGSSFGTTLRGIRDNEARMRSIGYSPAMYKLAAFVIAGTIAGGAGALLTAQQQFVTPGDLGFDVSAFALLAVVIGGSGSLWGPCLGAALVELVRNNLPSTLAGEGPLLLGIVFIAVVYLLPRGVAGLRLPPAIRRRIAAP